VNQNEDPAYHGLIKEASQWLQDNVDRVDTNFWPRDDVPWGDCVLPTPCHWDMIDLTIPPFYGRFNALRQEAMTYAQQLHAGPRSD